MFNVGDKVICIVDSIPAHMCEEIENDFEMWIKKGKEYTIRSFNDNDGIVVGVLLEEVLNFPKYFRLLGRSQEPSFKLDRFRKKEENEITEKVEEYVESN